MIGWLSSKNDVFVEKIQDVAVKLLLPVGNVFYVATTESWPTLFCRNNVEILEAPVPTLPLAVTDSFPGEHEDYISCFKSA